MKMSNTYAVFMEEIFDPKPFPFMTEPVTKSVISVLFFFFFNFSNILQQESKNETSYMMQIHGILKSTFENYSAKIILKITAIKTS